MIKVGIVGADKPDAGELLRLLINHPEVDIKQLYAPSMSGRHISNCHHGFIGEADLVFTDKFDLSKLNMAFIADDSDFGQEVIEDAGKYESLRVIDLSPSRFDRWSNTDMEYGLSETNRKPLVRGARSAIVPTSVASLALVALYPLAANLILPDEIFLTVLAPEDKAREIDLQKTAKEVERQIRTAQNSFAGNINIRVKTGASSRTMRVISSMKCPLAVAEIDRIYDSVYDDHNFTFTSLSEVGNEEVEGTQKCVISFCKPGAGLIEIESVGDCRLRGGAGDAVHVMNLLFALQEKVGLTLKPSCYIAASDTSSKQASWFA